MTPETARLLRTIDLTVLGGRLRDARLAAGLTQTQAAGGHASTAYVSRIESGHRRPDARLLEILAGRCNTTLDHLLCPPPAPELADLVGPVLDAVEDLATALERLQAAVTGLVTAAPTSTPTEELGGAA